MRIFLVIERINLSGIPRFVLLIALQKIHYYRLALLPGLPLI